MWGKKSFKFHRIIWGGVTLKSDVFTACAVVFIDVKAGGIEFFYA